MKRASAMTTIVKSNGRAVRLPGRPRWLEPQPGSGWRRMPMTPRKFGSFAGVEPRNLRCATPYSFEIEQDEMNRADGTAQS